MAKPTKQRDDTEPKIDPIPFNEALRRAWSASKLKKKKAQRKPTKNAGR